MRVAAIQLSMTDEDTVRRAANLTSTQTYQIRYPPPRQLQWKTSIYGAKAVQVMEQIYPLLSLRRRQKIAAFIHPPSHELPDTLAWFAGLMEAEGSFFHARRIGRSGYPICSISMVDEDVIARAADFIGMPYRIEKKPLGRQTQYMCRVERIPAIAVMQQITAFMSQRRQAQIMNAIGNYEPGHLVGEEHGRATLLNGVAREIYRRSNAGESTSVLAAEFGIRPALVSSIKVGRTWGEITGHQK